jgi:hypothetical protein
MKLDELETFIQNRGENLLGDSPRKFLVLVFYCKIVLLLLLQILGKQREPYP